MQKSKLPNLITTLILTLITALMWIGFTIYRAIITVPEPSVTAEISATLIPTLDTDTINKIKSGLFFSESQIPLPMATPIASASASPSINPTATPVPTATP